jgi:hypothetical protein
MLALEPYIYPFQFSDWILDIFFTGNCWYRAWGCGKALDGLWIPWTNHVMACSRHTYDWTHRKWKQGKHVQLNLLLDLHQLLVSALAYCHIICRVGWTRQVLWCPYFHQGRNCTGRKWHSRCEQQCPEGKLLQIVSVYNWTQHKLLAELAGCMQLNTHEQG